VLPAAAARPGCARCGLKRDRTASVIIEGHAFIQNLRRKHDELGIDALPGLPIAAAFDELALAV
jgi:transposase, IS6 family